MLLDAMETIGFAVAVGLLLTNIVVTVQLASDRDLSPTQKGLQSIIVWLIPLFGAVVVYLIRRGAREPATPQKRPFGGGDNDGMPGGTQPP